MTQTPSVCRRVVCSIGGYADLRTAVESAKVDVLVARTNAGVLGFGTDGDIRSTFDGYGITEFDLHTIEIRRLRYESGEPPSQMPGNLCTRRPIPIAQLAADVFSSLSQKSQNR